MATDPRYNELLGLNPDVSTPPTHFELLELDLGESDNEVISKIFKEKMKTLQQIKSSKHKGFIEMLKEDLRKAKRVLSNEKQRENYKESLAKLEEEKQKAALQAKIEDFKVQVSTFIMLGEITKHFFNVLLTSGTKLGLTDEQCRPVIFEMAKAANVAVNLEDPVEPSASSTASRPIDPPGPQPLNPPRNTSPRNSPVPKNSVKGTRPPIKNLPPRSGRHYTNVAPNTGSSISSRMNSENIAPRFATPSQVPSTAVTGFDRSGGYRPPNKTSFYGDNESSFSPVTPPKISSSNFSQAPAAPPPAMTPEYKQQLDDVRDTFNRGAKLAKYAIKAHIELSFYFPPKNNRNFITRTMNGISYEKIFSVESKLYTQAQRLFEKVKRDIRVGAIDRGLPDNFVDRLDRFITTLKGWSRRCREVKMKQMSGLSKKDELKVWNEFIRDPRSAEMTKPI